MVYILNKYISPKTKIKIGLQNIFGIGKKQSQIITNILCINPEKRFENLTNIQISNITKYITENYIIGTFLKKEILENIKKYKKIRNYRGLRHINKLPSRGQRTHTNAQTRRKMNI